MVNAKAILSFETSGTIHPAPQCHGPRVTTAERTLDVAYLTVFVFYALSIVHVLRVYCMVIL